MGRASYLVSVLSLKEAIVNCSSVWWGFSEVWIQAYTNSFNKYLLSMYALCWKYSSGQRVLKKAAPMGSERKDTSCDQLISPLLEVPSLSGFQGPMPSWFSSDLTASPLHLFSVYTHYQNDHTPFYALNAIHMLTISQLLRIPLSNT